MKKSFDNISLRQVFVLIFGILLGTSLSTIFLYPKISSIINSNNFKFSEVKSIAHELYDQSLANDLHNNIRILCWVLTMPENHKTKAIHVKNTWGRRCNKLLFMSTNADPEINSIALPLKNEDRSLLWDKTKLALQYIYNNHYNDADWFLKADDDSYFILENVRYMLSQYYSKTSLYFGHRYASKYSNSYMAGGGYILSRKALEKFVTKIMHDKNVCRIEDDGPEDLELGRCLENQTIFVDERDENKEKRFFPVGIMEHFGIKNENSTYWYDDMMYYESKYGGIECCSETIVNLHYISPKEMYMLDYLIYNVHSFGLKNNSTKLPFKKISLDDIVKASDIDSNAIDFQKSHVVYHEFDEDEKYKNRK